MCALLVLLLWCLRDIFQSACDSFLLSCLWCSNKVAGQQIIDEYIICCCMVRTRSNDPTVEEQIIRGSPTKKYVHRTGQWREDLETNDRQSCVWTML